MNGFLPQRGNSTINSGRGLLLIATGQREGFALFGADTRAYLGSLAPLVAFFLVSGGQDMVTDSPVHGAVGFFASLTGLLAPPVIAELFCRRWDRQAYWALYANVLNWAQMLMVMVVALAFIAARAVISLGLPSTLVAGLALLGVLAYGLWFQWFTARNALRLTRWQTAKLMLATQIGTGLLLVVPLAAGGDLKG